MKTTQLTSKVLVAAMLLTVVAPVVAANPADTIWAKTVAAAKTAWTKTKETTQAGWDKTKTAATTSKDATVKFFTPTKYANGVKEAELAQLNQVERIQMLETKIAAEKAVVFVNDDESTQAQAQYVQELERTLADYKAQNTGLRFNFKKLQIKHPNLVAYGSLSALTAAIAAGVTVAYKYNVHTKAKNAVVKGYNNTVNYVKSFFAQQSGLDKVVATVNAATAGKEVKTADLVLVDTPSFQEEVKACAKETVNALRTRVQEFNNVLAAHTTKATEVTKNALEKAKAAVVKAVEVCKAELVVKPVAEKAEVKQTEVKKAATTTTAACKTTCKPTVRQPRPANN